MKIFTHRRAGLAPVAAIALGAIAIAGAVPVLGAGPRPLTIVVRCAPFATVEAAAAAESLVHWTDADLSDDDACTESYAAVELRSHLRRCPGMAGRTIVLRASDVPSEGDVIVLGNPRSQPLVRELLGGSLPDPSSRDAYRIRALRRGDRTFWIIAGTSRTGTLYGTYAFLERLGIRFYGPEDAETVWPREAIALPASLDLASSPAFETRGFWAWEPRGNVAFFRWMARRRMNLWTAAEPGVALLRKLGIRLIGGGHSIQFDYLNPSTRAGVGGRTRFETHPEWFGLHAGRRSSNIGRAQGDNFCTSNPAAVAELSQNLVRSLRAGPLRNADLVNVWPLDGGRWCECDACRALGGPSDRALDLVRRLAVAVHEARRRGDLDRDVLLSAAAYLETMPPPGRPAPARDSGLIVTFFPYYRCYAHSLSDPSCTEINLRIQSAWEGWARAPGRAYRGGVGVCEYYNVSWFRTLPLVFPHVMARDIAEYHAAGARLFCYMHAPTARWGTWRLDHLVLSEALWRPGFDVDSLVADYCARAYPGARAEMATFYRALEIASSNIFAVELAIGAVFTVPRAPQGRLGVRSMPVFPYMHLPDAPAARPRNVAPAWSDLIVAMGNARAAGARARLAARNPSERSRLGDDLRRFAYGECTFRLYDCLFRLARADRGDPDVNTRQALASADSLAGELRAVRDLVQVAGADANARDGLDASHVAPALAYFHARFDPARGH